MNQLCNQIHSWIQQNRLISRVALTLSLVVTAGLLTFAKAQEKPKLFVSVLQTKSFVVGSRAPASGLYSYDGDTTWTHYGWKENRLNNMSYNPQNTNEMYMACGDGVFRTMDGGKNWRRMTGWSITEIENVAVDPFKPKNIYIASAYGVWRSNDSGASWDSSGVGIDSMYTQIMKIDQKSGSYLLVAGEGGIYRSTNGAHSWTHVGPVVAVRDIAQSKSDPDLWIAGTADHGAMISEDGGKTWRYLHGRLSGKTLYAVAIDPNDSRRMAVAGYETGIYISTNGGRSWIRRTRGLPTKNFHSLIFDPVVKGQLWAGSFDYGVYSTDNLGRSWKYRGLLGSQIWHMTFVRGTK